MSKFQTTTEMLRDAAVVKIAGYLSGHGGEKLEDEIDRLLEGGRRKILINFSATDLVNSVGVSILIGVIEKARHVNCDLAFTGLTPVNEEIFRLMGLHRHVPFLAAGEEVPDTAEGGAK